MLWSEDGLPTHRNVLPNTSGASPSRVFEILLCGDQILDNTMIILTIINFRLNGMTLLKTTLFYAV